MATNIDSPTLKELLEVSRELTRWYELGVQLDVEEHVLKEIEHRYDREGFTRCKTEMFSKWLRGDIAASWEKFVKALRAMGEQELAKRVIDKFLPDAYEPVRELPKDVRKGNEEMLGTKPSMSDLYCLNYRDSAGETCRLHIIDEIGPSWERLAFALKFSDTTVNTIKLNNRDYCEQSCRDILSRWLRGMNAGLDPRPLTWKTLVSALDEARCYELARKIETSLCTYIT